MRPVSEPASRIAGKAFERKYISLGRIVNRWGEIVGESFSLKAQPQAIRIRKDKDGKISEATLDIAVTPADSTLLHYQKDLILERINGIFGSRWITAIRFVPLVANERNKKPLKPRAPLTEGEKRKLSEMLNGIPDTGIKERLESLGNQIMMSEKK